MNFESFTMSSTIISILISLVTILCAAYQAIHQTRVTESLSTHDNQLKYRLYRGLYFFILVLIIVASIQFAGYVILSNISSNENKKDSIQTEQTIEENNTTNESNLKEIQLESAEDELESDVAESTDESEETIEGEKQFSLNKSDIIIILGEIAAFMVVCAITIICFVCARKKYKEKIKLRKEILGMICTALSFWAIANIILLSFLLEINIRLIVLFAFIIFELAKTSYDSITKSDWFPAKIKTKHKGKELFIYEMKDEFLLTGTDRYLFNCEEFYLIHAGELKNKIINSNSNIEIIDEDEENEKEIAKLQKKVKELEYEIVDIKGHLKKNKKHSLLDKIRDAFCI